MLPEPATPTPIADEDLMLRVQSSDEAAFAELMGRWELPVKSVIARLVLNASEAEDLAQEAFVRLWQHRAKFQAGRRFKPWLLGIAVNLARNRLRWWRHRPTVALDEWMEEPGSNASEAGAAGLERAEQAQTVRDAIAGLPHDYREALVLFEYEELSYQEIAELVGASAKVVENRIARGRAKLKAALGALRESRP
ncbi:MAG: sigma-70 family RNA polymerase sigma factor [Opitutaceae bacterium]|nr:sigma-70 family RNA polymerase sigma factor [Opitutaceae bacterium]